MTIKKISPYAPSFLRSAIENGKPIQLSFNDIKDTNVMNTSSFMYDAANAPLKSTQQLNVDWSAFENHTFFMSAEAKVNLAFEQIINGYPFDGTQAEVEHYFEKLTGFDRWVFDSFPKFHGQLMFTGTMPGESSPLSGTYIIVKDSAGTLYTELSKKTTGESILNPIDTSLSLEMLLQLPLTATVGSQIICQKNNSTLNHGFSLYLMPTTSTSSVEARFSVISGSHSMTVPCSLERGKFNHICAIYNKDNGNQYLQFFKNGEIQNTSNANQALGVLNINASDFIIGSGTAFSVGSTTITPTQTLTGTLDEFRVFHAVRSSIQQKNYMSKAIYAQPDLKLYFRFNEPPPPLATSNDDTANAIVIDSSGNSLHSLISNFSSYSNLDSDGNMTGSSLRQNASLDTSSKMIYEKEESVIVLFPAYENVIDLNDKLLFSASEFDRANPNLITRLIPQHYLLEGSLYDGYVEPEGKSNDSYSGTGIPGQGKLGGVQLMLSLLYIWARFFDEMKLYVDAFSTVRNVSYETNSSTPNNFLFDLVKEYGFILPPMFNDSTLEQYINAENIGQEISTNEKPLKYVQNELLRRILINLPDVIRSKGTQHSIKSFLRAVGIDPDNSVRLREFGGPTTRQLSSARENKRNVGTMTEFITSSLVISPFLSASRYEPGYPYVRGSFVNQNIFPPNGISNQPSDGLLTSGSWTVETLVKYTPINIRAMTSSTQSLLRMCVTGSMSDYSGLVANLLVVSSSIDPKLMLYFRPGTNENSPTLFMSMSLRVNDIFDGDRWHISFGCERNDSINSRVSSSYFLRLGNQNNGDIVYLRSTSSFFYELITSESNCLRDVSSSFNCSGSFLVLGENITVPEGTGTGYIYLNNTSRVNSEARVTAFTGRQSHLRFWSKALSENEWHEHIKNHLSTGVDDPLVNYNFVKTRSGSFERLRMDTLGKQSNRRANASASLGPLGALTFIDFSLNGMHLTGTGFPYDKDNIKGELYDYSYLSPYFDEAASNEKVRIRSFLNQDLVDITPWSTVAPSYELVKSEQPTDDTRFVVEFSLIDALNRDIITLFSTFDALDSALGSPELLLSPDYVDLEKMRNIYFNRIGEKLNFKSFFEFFRWFDTSVGSFIQQLIPRKTNFKGTNFVIESHMLERHKIQYYTEMYSGDSQRSRIKDNLLLQQIVGTISKY
jgi:hypothetical protein